jgi:hypothetical protein
MQAHRRALAFGQFYFLRQQYSFFSGRGDRYARPHQVSHSTVLSEKFLFCSEYLEVFFSTVTSIL